jgi:hypothetical protein
LKDSTDWCPAGRVQHRGKLESGLKGFVPQPLPQDQYVAGDRFGQAMVPEHGQDALPTNAAMPTSHVTCQTDERPGGSVRTSNGG